MTDKLRSSYVDSFLNELWQKYQTRVTGNPTLVTTVESTFRTLSYLIVGRFNDSTVASELVFAISNLLVVLNDFILRQAHSLQAELKQAGNAERLKQWLTVLEYVEVFLEMSFERLGGAAAKWFIVVVVQLAKATLRFLLLLHYKSAVQPSPPFPPVDRLKLVEGARDQSGSTPAAAESVVELKSSGRLMRSLASSPPINYREWRVPKRTRVASSMTEHAHLSSQTIAGESLHIMRPLTHLTSMYLFGRSSWKPWMLAGLMDVLSLLVLHREGERAQHQQTELNRRQLLLLSYLLRSPFYDHFTRDRVVDLLESLSGVPLISLLAEPLQRYLPMWQRNYGYNWST